MDRAARDRARDAVLAANPIVPVITIDEVRQAVPLARALLAGGVTALEITLRTPVALEAARIIIGEVPDAIVGLGTVTRPDDLAEASRIGAHFAISPGSTSDLLAAARDCAVPLLPGVATASEVMAAVAAGFNVVKFFPAVPAGGLAAIKALAGPFPDVRFCPTGGIGEATFVEWLKAPMVVSVGGSWLAPPDLVRHGAWPEITAIARRSVAAARAARP